jgi:hypothetical protein
MLELIKYFRERKKVWLMPIIGILLLIGFLVVFSAGSAVTPFIYAIF